MLRLVSLFGLVCMMALAWALSERRQRIPWRIVLWGLGLQFAVGLLLLPTPVQTYVLQPMFKAFVWLITFGCIETQSTPGEIVFVGMAKVVDLLTGATIEGAKFIFGTLSTDYNIGAVMAFQVLPVIILVSSIAGILFHFHIIQAVVWFMAWLMRRTLKTSGAETFGTALLVFMGIESMTAIRAYIAAMTRSELCTVMTAFMATIAGSVMVVYATFGAEPGNLLAASLMSAPAAILISKLMVPETETPATQGFGGIKVEVESTNVVDAAARGAAQGLNLALNVAAMIIAFLGLVYILNMALETMSRPLLAMLYAPMAASHGWPALESISLQSLFGFLFTPFAFLMGVPRADLLEAGQLLGVKTVMNEFLAYAQLKDLRDVMSPRGVTIITYALCGFANPGSLAIIIAGMTGLAPERQKDIVQLGLKAFIGGTLACFMTACVAGVIYA